MSKMRIATKKIGNTKKNQTGIMELKNYTNLKNPPEGFKSILHQAKERISELKDRSFEMIYSEEQKKGGGGGGEESIRDFYDTNDRPIYALMNQKEKRERSRELVWKNNDWKWNLGKDMGTQIKRAQIMPPKMNSKKSTLRYIVIKPSKVQRLRGNLESS